MTIPQTVSGMLGGQARLRARPRGAQGWHALIRQGIPVEALDAFKANIAVSDAELAQLLGVNERTLSRARTGRATLDPVASDRLYRAVRVVALAIDTIEDRDNAVRWLKRPQVGLGGTAPLALMTTDAGCTEVERLLLRIEHGVYS